MTPELPVIRLIALKGRESVETLGVTLRIEPADVATVVDEAVTAGHLTGKPTALRLTPSGRERLAELLRAESNSLDTAAVHAVYDRFTPINTEAKTVFTAWQLRPSGEPNSHDDPQYDQEVVARIEAVHSSLSPVLDDLGRLVSRASGYADRLTAAWNQIGAGDHRFVTSPLVDSYHSVWFELHEDFIGWAGLTRADEAAAGRAD